MAGCFSGVYADTWSTHRDNNESTDLQSAPPDNRNSSGLVSVVLKGYKNLHVCLSCLYLHSCHAMSLHLINVWAVAATIEDRGDLSRRAVKLRLIKFLAVFLFGGIFGFEPLFLESERLSGFGLLWCSIVISSHSTKTSTIDYE